ncbi:hypothetical protein [Frigoribacterium salinisoli]
MTRGRLARATAVVLATAALLSGCALFPDAEGALDDLRSWAAEQEAVVGVVDADVRATNAANPFSRDSEGSATIVLDDDAEPDDVARVARDARGWARAHPDPPLMLRVEGPGGAVDVTDDAEVLDAALVLVAEAAGDPDVTGLDVDVDAVLGRTHVVVRRAQEAPPGGTWTAWAAHVAAGTALTAAGRSAVTLEVSLPAPDARADAASRTVAGQGLAREASVHAARGARTVVGGLAGSEVPDLAWLEAVDEVPGVIGWTVDGTSARVGVPDRTRLLAVESAVRALPGDGAPDDLHLVYGDVDVTSGDGAVTPTRRLWAQLDGTAPTRAVEVGEGVVPPGQEVEDRLEATTAGPRLALALRSAIEGDAELAEVVLSLRVLAAPTSGAPSSTTPPGSSGSSGSSGEVLVQGTSAGRAAVVLPELTDLLRSPDAVTVLLRRDGAVDVSTGVATTDERLVRVADALRTVPDGTAVSIDFSPRERSRVGQDDTEIGPPLRLSFVAARHLDVGDVETGGSRVPDDGEAEQSRAWTEAFVVAWNAR